MSSNGSSGDEFGVRDDGSFNRKYINDISESLKDYAREEFGEEVDLAPGSPHRQLIDVATLELADLWESLEGTYYAAFFEDAWGEALDRVLSLAGVGRLPRQGAYGEVTFHMNNASDSEVVVPKSTRVETQPTNNLPAIPFKTTEQARIPAGQLEATQVPIRAMEPFETDVSKEYLGDDTNVNAGTITELIDQPPGPLMGVNNPLPTGTSGTRPGGGTYNFVSGRDRESDQELRYRYKQTLGTSGTATRDAVRAHVYALDNVQNARIEENTSMDDNTASGGLPPKSFRVTALSSSGVLDTIAQAILESRPIGIESYGTNSGTAVDDDGTEIREYVDLAGDVVIYVEADIWVEQGFPSNGIEQIKNNIISYIGGRTTYDEERIGTTIGEDVMRDRVFGACLSGSLSDTVYQVDLRLGRSSTPTDSTNVAIASDEAAMTTPDAVTINKTVGTIP